MKRLYIKTFRMLLKRNEWATQQFEKQECNKFIILRNRRELSKPDNGYSVKKKKIFNYGKRHS